MTEIVPADTSALVEQARALFTEYADSLGFSLCFQRFEEELASLPGAYAPPRGRLLLALVDDEAAARAGVRPVSDIRCEMKRLYVRPAFRGRGIGRALAEATVRAARSEGYAEMVLDTISAQMEDAVALYRELGFEDTEPYYDNPLPGVAHMRLELR